jgi:hypothetical protein
MCEKCTRLPVNNGCITVDNTMRKRVEKNWINKKDFKEIITLTQYIHNLLTFFWNFLIKLKITSILIETMR